MTLPLSNTGKEVDRYDHTRALAHVSKIAFPNTKMNPIVLRGDNNMEAATNKYTWADTDNDWELALKISDYYGAIEIVDGLPNESSDDLWTALNKLIGQINRTDTTSGAASTLAIVGTVNIQNQLDSNVYIPDQTVFDN